MTRGIGLVALCRVALALGFLLMGGHPALGAEPPPTSPQTALEAMSDDETGFVPIFDGKTLKGWDGDPYYWRVENGDIVGETTEITLPKRNSFIIWRGGRPKDFELKMEYRVSRKGNSGLQYRSAELPGVKWVLRGYQFDIDGREWSQMFGPDAKRATAQNYEEGGRGTLCPLGQLSYIAPGKTQRIVASLGSNDEIDQAISDDWNRAHLIARGNLLIHILNGRVMSILIDADSKKRQLKGVLGMQVHVGPPMKVEFRNIRIKML
jgi:hypothetical protein